MACSIWNEGIHVEYRWNGSTKMAGISPKIYSTWNGWNPPGIIWIPHGIHVECGGRVKTSHALLDQALTEYYPKYILDTIPSAQGTDDLSRNEYAVGGEPRNLKKC